jgi:HEXXH motif-containing protein
MEATGLDVGVLLHEGALSEQVQESRRELLERRRARLVATATATMSVSATGSATVSVSAGAGANLLGCVEGVLVMRAGWIAPWLDAEQRSALRHHLTCTARGEGLAGEGLAGGWSCGAGSCPLCSGVDDCCGYDTATRCLTEVDAISAGLIRHLVSQRADAGYPARVLTLATPEVVAQAQGRLAQALDLLAAYVPWWDALRESTARRLVLFESPHLLGFSSPLVPQTLFVNATCDVLRLAERLVHEATHLQVYDAQDVLRFTDAPGTLLISSPLRADRRPVLGVLHATVVSARVVAAMRAVSSGADGELAASASAVAARVTASVVAGSAELLANGQLTSAGKALVCSLDDVVTG